MRLLRVIIGGYRCPRDGKGAKGRRPPRSQAWPRASRATEIAVGVQAEVDGVENERGLVEAKKVKLTR
ncbi:MAG: hypothetical protein A3J29_07605 [Acidobacteria bacterium RIFCSPLOWO2_12_FULL_67_14b]|nr:MAG: hypothetical protein A3J29_07605 [Acidobacteria bacterium RIFCSPLOWO2_12_FULL_67_14b]